eukprot:GSMAST32.ASY1.ANO1.1118.1 assembled CDS
MGAGASIAESIESSSMSASCKAFCHCFEQVAARDRKGNTFRVQAWGAIDPNNNGKVSLAEFDAWIKKSLIGCEGKEEGTKHYLAFKPSYIRAFEDAKNLVNSTSEGNESNSDEYLDRKEFRGAASYLCLYAVMYDAFALIDGFGGTVDDKKGDDRKISLEEWNAGHAKLKTYEAAVDANAEKIFNEMDADKKGAVLLNEFCAWIEKKESEAGTACMLQMSKFCFFVRYFLPNQKKKKKKKFFFFFFFFFSKIFF